MTNHYIKTIHQIGYFLWIYQYVDKIIVRQRVQNALNRQLSDKVSESGHRSGIIEQNDNVLGTCSCFNIPRTLPTVVQVDAMTFPPFCGKMAHYARIRSEILPRQSWIVLVILQKHCIESYIKHKFFILIGPVGYVVDIPSDHMIVSRMGRLLWYTLVGTWTELCDVFTDIL